MDCAICNNKLTETKGVYTFHSKIIGKINIPNIKIFKCLNCDERLLFDTESEKVLNYVENKEQEAIGSLPIGEFITTNQAAEILGISKQAFSKDPKIKRGFILSHEIGGKKLFLRKSVELFKKKKNGIFQIVQLEQSDCSYIEFHKYSMLLQWIDFLPQQVSQAILHSGSNIQGEKEFQKITIPPKTPYVNNLTSLFLG